MGNGGHWRERAWAYLFFIQQQCNKGKRGIETGTDICKIWVVFLVECSYFWWSVLVECLSFGMSATGDRDTVLLAYVLCYDIFVLSPFKICAARKLNYIGAKYIIAVRYTELLGDLR